MCDDYPDMTTHLSSNTNIVLNSVFEQGLSKILDGSKQNLCPTEKKTVQRSRLSTLDDDEFESSVAKVVSPSRANLKCEVPSDFEKLEHKHRRVWWQTSTHSLLIFSTHIQYC